ncbi:hypothetical protein [Pollutibacter soli]|uniref:hypothetical protein n=1 Tax=Pollutibacter soli TaxID=3034157 RepID=UPI003013D57B
MYDVQLVAHYYDSDCPDRVSQQAEEELKRRIEENQGRPLVHMLKTFIDEYPESLIEAGATLAALYHIKKEEKKSQEWIKKLVARYPESASVYNFRLELLFGKDDFDAIEKLIDLEKTYPEQFPQRKIVSVEEYFRYEYHGIRWLLVNMDTNAAIARATSLSKKLESVDEYNDYMMQMAELFEDYIPEDEYTPELNDFIDELLQAVNGFALPNLLYPELSVLFTPVLSEKDLPKVRNLLRLEPLTLGADLFVIVHDCFDPFKYHDYENQTAGFQLMLSLIMMAGINDEHLLEVWSMVLEKDEVFLDFWLGDDLADEMFYVGYVAGAEDPSLIDAIFDFSNKTFQANFSILISLAGIAWHIPQKRPEVLDIFERRMKELLEVPFNSFTDRHRKLLTEFIDQSSLLDANRFSGIYRLALEEDRVDLNRIDPDEIFNREETEFTKRFQYPLFIELLEDKLVRLYTDGM